MHIRKAHALRGKTVRVRHGNRRSRVVAGQVSPAQIIGQNIHNVWPSGPLLPAQRSPQRTNPGGLQKRSAIDSAIESCHGDTDCIRCWRMPSPSSRESGSAPVPSQHPRIFFLARKPSIHRILHRLNIQTRPTTVRFRHTTTDNQSAGQRCPRFPPSQKGAERGCPRSAPSFDNRIQPGTPPEPFPAAPLASHHKREEAEPRRKREIQTNPDTNPGIDSNKPLQINGLLEIHPFGCAAEKSPNPDRQAAPPSSLPAPLLLHGPAGPGHLRVSLAILHSRNSGQTRKH